jgi:hypothetical protein
LKRHSPSDQATRVPSAPGIPDAARSQLTLPFGNPAASPGSLPDVGSRSERALRHTAAARQVRLAPTLEEEAARTKAALSLYLPPGKSLELHVTNNHYSMISVRRKADGYRLRLHRMFVGAEARVMRALARYVVHNDRRASAFLGEYIEGHQHIIRRQERRPRNFTLRTAGRFHDLQAIFNRLNAERFGGALDARITWGAIATRRSRRRSIKMGSYAVEDRIIRIHPALDQDFVPDYFVSWIVFHEMLHGKHEVRREHGRRRFHTPAFVEEERTFADFPRACAWEKQNLDRLLRG